MIIGWTMSILILTLLCALIVLEVSWFLSPDMHRRFWQDIYDRTSGPMTFRFLLQPTTAMVIALYDGIKSARTGHGLHSYYSSLEGRLNEGLSSSARVVLLGLGMDLIYQIKVLRTFYPVEALMVTLPLVIIPYFLFRWLVERVSRWWLAQPHGPTDGRF
jgi:hypothetical protein